jgi:hypothetical protein
MRAFRLQERSVSAAESQAIILAGNPVPIRAGEGASAVEGYVPRKQSQFAASAAAASRGGGKPDLEQRVRFAGDEASGMSPPLVGAQFLAIQKDALKKCCWPGSGIIVALCVTLASMCGKGGAQICYFADGAENAITIHDVWPYTRRRLRLKM